jgi:Na+-transporting NADH:ubiquinone oxidoreductase subunit F
MPVTIDINQATKVIAAAPGQTLLSVLGANGVFIPSACGGRAICGMCKVKVLDGAGPLTPGEQRLLSDKEKSRGVRLSCQIKTDADLRIEIPEELFIARKYRCRVASLGGLNYDTKELRLTLLSPERMIFRAGQFVQLIIPPHDAVSGETVRAYSIASPPSRGSELELTIRAVPNGIATLYIHTRCRAGDELSLIGPMGEFGLHEGDSDMICIAGGSGLAPIKSILTDMFEKKIPKRSVWYFFGAVARRDLFYVPFFRELEKQWPIFHFVPALSAPAEGDDWRGETGLIPEVAARYLDERLERAAPKEAYLCGSPGLINASLKALTGRGMARDKIYFDKFV